MSWKTRLKITPEDIFHTWTYKKDNKTVSARFVSYEDGILTLADKKNNEIKVKPTELVPEDIAFYKSEIARLAQRKEEIRVWTIDGKPVTAAFETEKDGTICLRFTQKVGKEDYTFLEFFNVSQLAKGDRAWLEEMKAAK